MRVIRDQSLISATAALIMMTMSVTMAPAYAQTAADAAAEARLDEIAGYFDAPHTGLDLWNLALDRNREARLERDK